MTVIKVNSNVYYSKNKDNLNNENYNNDDIYLIYQFFIHKNEKRYAEIKYCLKKNIELGVFKKIILLNEKIYTKEELGLTNDELKYIEQININERLKYSYVFNKVQELDLKGYIVFCNSDIFFDKTILNVRKSILSKEKSLYALLRFEYDDTKNIECSELFHSEETGNPRYDAQDTWIYHTSQFQYNTKMINNLDIQLGILGCDNKIGFIFINYGYKCYNEPRNIKTYHYHMEDIRDHDLSKRLKPPYLYIDINN